MSGHRKWSEVRTHKRARDGEEFEKLREAEERAQTIREQLQTDMRGSLVNAPAGFVLTNADKEEIVDALLEDAMFQIEKLLEEGKEV